MTLEKIFKDVNTFREFTPYAESNVTFKELQSNGLSAIKQICLIIGNDVFQNVIDDCTYRSYILTAVANLTSAKQLVFSVMKSRKQDVDVYKHEQEAMRRSYIENYYGAMDSLIEALDDNDNSIWKSSNHYLVLKSLRVQTAPIFDSFYRIDCSYLYFFRTIAIQREVLDDYLESYYQRCAEDTKILRQLDRVLTKMIVATSLRRFDMIELPSTIRSLFNDSNVSRSGSDEYTRLYALSDELMNEAKEQLRAIDLIINSSSSNIDTETSFNNPHDKIILL